MRRLTYAKALRLMARPDLLSLAEKADKNRSIHGLGRRVSYIVDRNINYTDSCVSKCKFCAFWRKKGSVIGRELLACKIKETLALGGTQILLQGGLHPSLRLGFYEDMVRFIKSNFKIHVHAFSPPEIVHFSRLNMLTVREVVSRLKDAGLDSIPGGGAEMLTDRLRRRNSPRKCTADQWLAVMREAHLQGMKTTATMVFGMGETVSERISHLEKIRRLQDQTGGFTAFIPWTFQPGNTRMAGVTKATAFDYLATLALSRAYFDNIRHVQASWVTQGLGMAQVALKFGADDIGSVMIEENVVASTGLKFSTSEKELVGLISSAGFTPVKRTSSVYDRFVAPL